MIERNEDIFVLLARGRQELKIRRNAHEEHLRACQLREQEDVQREWERFLEAMTDVPLCLQKFDSVVDLRERISFSYRIQVAGLHPIVVRFSRPNAACDWYLSYAQPEDRMPLMSPPIDWPVLLAIAEELYND